MPAPANSNQPVAASPEPRPIHRIAREIAALWARPYFGAVPYVRAMHSLSSPSDTYGCEDAKSIILYFLANAGSWRGPEARRLKTELRALVKGKLPTP